MGILEDQAVNVGVQVQDDSIVSADLNIALILTDEVPLVVISTRTREYFSTADIAADWGNTSKVFKAASPHFLQQPHNQSIKIGLRIPKGTIQTLNSITVAANIATLTDPAPHGLSIGQEITVSGAAGLGLNGVKVIIDVPSTATATFAAAGVGDGADGNNGFIDYHTGDVDLTTGLEAIFNFDPDFFHLLSIFKVKADIKEIAAFAETKPFLYAFSIEDINVLDQADTTDTISELAALDYKNTYGVWYHQSGVDALGVGVIVSPITLDIDINTLNEIATVSDASSPLNHGLDVGDKVTISDAGTSSLNGLKTITGVPTLNTFTYAAPGVGDGADANNGGSNGGIDWQQTQSEIATVTELFHGLRVSDNLTVSGAVPSGLNGNKTVLKVLDLNRFTYDASGVVDGTATGTIDYFARYEFIETGIQSRQLGTPAGIGGSSWAYKNFTGFAVSPDDILSSSQALTIARVDGSGKGGMFYKNLAGAPALQYGRTVSGRTVKVQAVALFLKIRLQEAGLQAFIGSEQFVYTNASLATIANALQGPLNLQLDREGITPLNDTENFQINYLRAAEVPLADKNANIARFDIKVRSGNEILSLAINLEIIT